jgi:ketosteroid isomerase-like protein
MHRIVASAGLYSLLIGAAAFAVPAVTTPRSDAAEALPALDVAMNRAILAGDTKALEGILADDYVLITSSGRVVDREAFLAEVAKDHAAIEVSDSSAFQVRQHGDLAVLTGVLHQKGNLAGKTFDAWLRYTDTWVWEDGSWKYLSGHASRMPEDEAQAMAASAGDSATRGRVLEQ